MPTTTRVTVFAGALPLAVDDRGGIRPNGRAYLLLHGGAGPPSMAGLAGPLAERGRSVLPTHPGFEGQPRPEWFRSVGDLALAYLALIERLGLDDVVVVGNSVGGWIAAEMGLRASPRLSALVLLNAVGLAPTPDTGGIVDPAAVAPAERAGLAYHDPARFAVAPTGPTSGGAEAAAAMAANQAALRVYAGDPFMHAPALGARLAGLALPTLVLWGESDRIVTPAYGRRFAELTPGARFVLVPEAGHFPQIERPDAVTAAVDDFLHGVVGRG